MTTLQIWNMALGYIGTSTIASERENRPEAIQCKLYYDSARRQVLRDYPWNFAQARIHLAQKQLPKVREGQWTFAYALPSNCLKAQHVYSQGNTKDENFEVAYDANDGNSIILTNVENAILEYTVDINDANRFDDSFIYVLSRKLACMIAIALLKNNAQKLQELETLYRDALPKAHENASAERKERTYTDDWIRMREDWA